MSRRTFATGANRDTNVGKPNHARYNSPLVDAMYARYIHDHNEGRKDGPRRGDNWKKGMPFEEFLESFLRHVLDVRMICDGHDSAVSLEDALCAARFNLNGMMYELAQGRAETDRGGKLRRKGK